MQVTTFKKVITLGNKTKLHLEPKSLYVQCCVSYMHSNFIKNCCTCVGGTKMGVTIK